MSTSERLTMEQAAAQLAELNQRENQQRLGATTTAAWWTERAEIHDARRKVWAGVLYAREDGMSDAARAVLIDDAAQLGGYAADQAREARRMAARLAALDVGASHQPV